MTIKPIIAPIATAGKSLLLVDLTPAYEHVKKSNGEFEKLNEMFERSWRIATLHGIILDFEKWSIVVDDKEVFLTNKEFDIFVYLLEHESKKLSANEIKSKILVSYEKNETLTESIDDLNTKIQPLEIRKLSDDEFIFER